MDRTARERRREEGRRRFARLAGPREGPGEKLQLADVALDSQEPGLLRVKVKVDNYRLAGGRGGSGREE